MTINCLECGKRFDSPYIAARLCSADCRTGWARRRAREHWKQNPRERSQFAGLREYILPVWRVETRAGGRFIVLTGAAEISAEDLAEMKRALENGARDKVCRGCGERYGPAERVCGKCRGTSFGPV